MWLLFLMAPVFTWAIPVLHFIKPESSFLQITTLDSCTTFKHVSDPVGCNPALFPYQKAEGLKLGLTTITDGESVEVGHRLLFDPIKREFLEEIFNKRSFNSWALNTFIELRTSKFFLGYDPLSVNADVFVFNPSSPEVAMSLVKSNRLHLTTGQEIISNDFLKISIGAKIFYFRSEYYQDSFFLSDLSNQDIEDLIDLKDRSGVAADLGAFIQFEEVLLPKVSFLLKNINSPYTTEDRDVLAENQLRPLLTYETYGRIGLGYDFKSSWGVLNTELNLPFRKYFEDYYNEYLALSLSYGLSRVSAQITYSKFQQVMGFYFGSKIASVGVFYAQNRPLGDFSPQTESLSGVRVEVSL